MSKPTLDHDEYIDPILNAFKVNCPECGQFLWNEDTQEFDLQCIACGWRDPRPAPELPEFIQGALGFMQLLIEKVEGDQALSPVETQLLQDAIFAAKAG